MKICLLSSVDWAKDFRLSTIWLFTGYKRSVLLFLYILATIYLYFSSCPLQIVLPVPIFIQTLCVSLNNLRGFSNSPFILKFKPICSYLSENQNITLPTVAAVRAWSSAFMQVCSAASEEEGGQVASCVTPIMTGRSIAARPRRSVHPGPSVRLSVSEAVLEKGMNVKSPTQWRRPPVFSPPLPRRAFRRAAPWVSCWGWQGLGGEDHMGRQPGGSSDHSQIQSSSNSCFKGS